MMLVGALAKRFRPISNQVAPGSRRCSMPTACARLVAAYTRSYRLETSIPSGT
jgi:hypothetical protein